MDQSKKNRWILECLHQLIANNVIGDKQYDSRYKGFRGEMSFYERCRSNGTLLYSGGYLLPTTAGAETTQRPIYFTVTSDPPDEVYKKIYSSIGRLECTALYFIQYDNTADPSSWPMVDIMGNGIPLPLPEMKTWLFDVKSSEFKLSVITEFIDQYLPTSRPNKTRYPIEARMMQGHISNLIEFHPDDLLSLYVQRLVFDGMIGFGRVRGIPSDIDGIVCKNNNPEYLLEIKEKDLSKREPRGFGMDLHRIESLRKISMLTGLPYYYVVRQVDNQTDRKFLQWLCIEMGKFVDCVKNYDPIEGGTGMRSEYSNNPTRVCPQEKFKIIT